MEFNKKLQELRKRKGLTQEELAQLLFVSRTAISKWESGRGYPNLDSLKALAKVLDITVDELLSSDELLTIAEQDTKKKQLYLRDLVFGLLDLSVAMLCFLPFFAEKTGGTISEVSLLSLTDISLWLRIAFYVVVVGNSLWGILILALQNIQQSFWMNYKSKISLIFGIVGTILFIISQQPYAAIFMFIFLIIKVLMLIKQY